MEQYQDKIERILVRGTNWIGDAVMSTPALQRLRSSFPQAHIALLATRRTTALFEDSPLCDEVIEYRRRSEGIRALSETVKTLRARRFDLAVLFQNAFEAALVSCLGGARLRIGYAEQWRGLLLTHKLHRGPKHRNRHQVNDYLDIVAECERACLGSEFKAKDSNPVPAITASARQKDAARELLECFGVETGSRSLIAINAGATNSRAKCWPAERFAALADRLVKEMNAQIVLIGAPTELEYADNVISQMETNGVADLTGKTAMVELIGLLDLCDLVVSNDTGPAHIAAALGRPTITLFGPTNEFETAPAGEIMRAAGIECAGCMQRDCPIDHRCMTRISANEVFERTRKILNR
jgi:heptosyltransferase II